jgi:hypothetical protein
VNNESNFKFDGNDRCTGGKYRQMFLQICKKVDEMGGYKAFKIIDPEIYEVYKPYGCNVRVGSTPSAATTKTK